MPANAPDKNPNTPVVSPNPADTFLRLMPKQVFWSSFLVGIMFVIGCAVAVILSWIENDLAALVMYLVVSLGITLVVFPFSGWATGKYNGFTLAGAAATFVAIFVTLINFGPKPSPPYVKGAIENATANGFRDAYMERGFDTLWNYNDDHDSFHFAVFGKTKQRDEIKLYVDIEENDQKNDGGFFVVHLTCLSANYTGSKDFSWKIEKASFVGEGETTVDTHGIYDTKNKRFISYYVGISPDKFNPECLSKEAPKKSPVLPAFQPNFLLDLFGIFPAQANGNEKKRVDMIRQISAEEFKTAIENLTSFDKFDRRTARNTLSYSSFEQVKSLFAVMEQSIKDQIHTYRTVLGGSVALTRMLRRNPSLAAELRKTISVSNLELLLDAANHKDRTMRVYATEFLYDLNDPRLPALAFDRAVNTKSAIGRYNWLIASQGGWKALGPQERLELKPKIEEIRKSVPRTKYPRTNRLLDEFES